MHRQSGFSLIEVLVAMVILIIGIIGVFNLHIIAKRSSFESFQQSQAAFLASDMVNRMKLNISQLALYSNATVNGSLVKPEFSCDGVNADVCSSDQTGTWDLYSWQQLLRGSTEQIGEQFVGGLDQATGCIQIMNNNVAIAITWHGLRDTGDSTVNADAFVQGCGTSHDKRRFFLLETVISL